MQRHAVVNRVCGREQMTLKYVKKMRHENEVSEMTAINNPIRCICRPPGFIHSFIDGSTALFWPLFSVS
jgi:hypothetical protein